MTLTRRRFLAITAAALGSKPAQAGASWRGVAFGAEATIELGGPGAKAAVPDVVRLIRKIEAVFSIYDPASEVLRLNAEGVSKCVSPALADVLDVTDEIHRVTGGLLDPTVQGLWPGQNGPVGWHLVKRSERRIRLAAGQKLTFNGIAQGYATDQVAERLQELGFGQALINVGEHRGLGGPWRLQIEDPHLGPLGLRRLQDSAIATSSPDTMVLPDGRRHIFDPQGKSLPLWSTVSVEADRAVIADAFSTAACLMDGEAISEAMKQLQGIRRVTLVDSDGRLRTLH